MSNYLLGRGERLVEDVVGVRGGGPKQHPYTLFEARTRLRPMLTNVVSRIDELPPEACPDDQAVAAVTLNPEYIAKSYYPAELFKTVGVDTVGSRARRIRPAKRSRGREPEEALTTEFFVMGPRAAFRNWSAMLPGLESDDGGAKELITIEEISTPSPRQKIKGELPRTGEAVLEVVLHTDALHGERRTLPLFRDYLRKLGLDASFDRRFYAGGLCFVELDAPVQFADRIALFTPVRVLRQMPRLRMLRPTIRAVGIPTQALALPSESAVDPNIRAAIFDGGVPDSHPLTTWAAPIDATGGGGTSDEFSRHGVAVTSAFLFGHIDPTKPLPRPYAPVDHYRVMDTTPGQDLHQLFEVLERIDRVLAENQYDFINLSLGPRLPIEDDDVHAWTAVLDDRLARGNTLATIAVGNDGEGDATLGLNRIQVPSDCVNALAVGACDSPASPWQRAAYSSVGPGRSPGIIKPDILEFGGSLQRPFLALSHVQKPTLDATGGTSFAAPSTLRLATGVRAHFGPSLNTLAIHALIVHCAEPSKHPCAEVGRGRVARSLQDIVICGDDTVRVVYQGVISPARYIRAPIPVPPGTMPGMVTLTATLCFSTAVDPHHPGNYTRAGLEPIFRPHDGKRKDPEQLHSDTKSFFGKAQKGLTEEELRRDAWKWENCLHASHRFHGKTLRNPVFDIHYNARLEGRNFTPDKELNYALIISVGAKRIADLYDQVVRKYATQLEPLRPIIEIPVTT